ncbi:MAG TPA: glycosyltransferase family 2 protein [Bryobacteraceae bacterium]|nr:glycosyltransferase family 2 protein [Bryobacteraceae bacterium]
MSLTAIVPVWNGREYLAHLLASLARQTEPASELLVVDNGSTDGAPELAREHGARVIAMGRNAGFAPAVNRGIRESGTEWVAVLNSDVELAPDYFATLRRAGAPFATGKILSAKSPDRVDATFDAIARSGCAARLGQGSVDGPFYSKRRSIWSAPWTAAVFRVEIFERVGLLNEAFESYLEDVEFGIRCALHGISGLYVPEAVAWHHGSAALGRWHPETVRRIARNQCYVVAIHYPFGYTWHILVGQALWGLVAARHGGMGAWFRGKGEGLWNYRRFRKQHSLGVTAVLDEWFGENEKFIRDQERVAGWHWYWKMYFLLTGGGTK